MRTRRDALICIIVCSGGGAICSRLEPKIELHNHGDDTQTHNVSSFFAFQRASHTFSGHTSCLPSADYRWLAARLSSQPDGVCSSDSERALKMLFMSAASLGGRISGRHLNERYILASLAIAFLTLVRQSHQARYCANQTTASDLSARHLAAADSDWDPDSGK